ncbi:MAG: hypothetical protein JW801_05730 [Bacteroidales bacterium]|nr:hypothetical protein [Bacteroidales bacterium]
MKPKVYLFALLLMAATNLQAQKFKGPAPTPPMGWDSWNTFGVDIHEDLFRKMVDILVESGMKDAGYQYVVVDDGWEALSRTEPCRIQGTFQSLAYPCRTADGRQRPA